MVHRIKLAFILLLFFTSCLGSKRVAEKTSDKSLIEITKTDSTAKETVNKGIEDKAVFKVAESSTGDVQFDNRVNDAVANILRSINFQKSSGDNSYRLYYDEKLRELTAQIQVGETSSKEVATNKEVDKEQTETSTESLKKYTSMIPWWGWLIGFIVLFKQIMGVIGVIYPPARGITSIAELFRPPNK